MTTLDIEQPEALIAYLRARGHLLPQETPQIRLLAGGVSNRTVYVQRESGEAWVIKQALEKLRVPVDWFSSPQRIHREAEGLRWLSRLAPPGTIPAFVFEDHDAHLLAMAAVPQPHHNWKTLLLGGQLDVDHVRQFGVLLAAIHTRAQADPATAAAFADTSFFESLRLEPYYAYTASQIEAAADFLHDLIEKTRAHRLTLVHGDYSPKNILIYQDRLVLLDHEVIHFGDPGFDLGFSLTHLLSKAHHLTALRRQFAQAAQHYWQTYCQDNPLITPALEARAVRHTLACLLARVAGRSPLEYLSASERTVQRDAVLALIDQPPATLSDLITAFIERL
jgi:aminoglycoside phosphotransferase (APT) family kinase protein